MYWLGTSRKVQRFLLPTMCTGCLKSLAFQRGIFYSVRDLETEKCGQNSRCFSIQTDKSLTYLYIGISLMLLSL
ncbi:hypothetical protein RO04_11255 [Aggregatibacter actinomycetemcomitans]|uniref:Uncharacterized protein n=1 Tax=Aggregatibacter actinomycetemcomitans TaxID=714 RepID=A0A2G1DTH2_AGGAC|nr:hypothetical protein RO04_11255 [Aggregatibacter actinomycetemcomitans]PHO21704.1 hypothetical protein CQR80_01035 [Aggregatibacter actinomycetemcomitans]PHO23943.1 hypothetical protein CQR79_01070 [Aggregatibacter actinomycetemcomitans]